MNSTRLTAVVYTILAAFAFWTVYLYFYNTAVLTWLTREDSVSESVSAICYLLSACIFFAEWIRGKFRNVFVLGYALLFFVVGGEEISWGQRIFGMQTPEALVEINVQGETNLHNIDGIHQNVRVVGLLVVFTIAVLMPLTQRWIQILRQLYSRLKIPIVPLWTLPITICALLFMAIPRAIWNETIFTLDEVGELYLSLVFLLFAISARIQGTGLRPQSS